MRKQLLKDSAVYLGGSIVTQLLGFAGLVALMHFLSVGAYGKYTYIIEFITIFAFFSDGGFTQHIVKEASQRPHAVGEIYAKAQSAQVLVSGLMLALIFAISYTLNSFQDFYYIAVFGLSVVISAYFAPMLAVLVATGRKDIIFFKDVVVSILRFAGILLGIYLQAHFSYFIYLGFINCLVLVALFLYIRYKEAFRYMAGLRLRMGESFAFLKQGIFFTILMAANVLYSKIDIVMLEKMIGSTEVGYYSGATRFIYPFMFISTAFMTAVFPKLAKHSEEEDTFKKIQSLAFYYLGGIGIALSAALFLSADFIFELFFEDKYDQSVPVFKVLVWFLAIVFIYGPISNSLVAKNKIRFLVMLNIAMIGVNITLNFFLIPLYGAKGAAISTIICETLVLVAAFMYWKNVAARAPV